MRSELLAEYNVLNDFVQKARKALESTSVKNSLINLEKFPKGACGDASLLLGNALQKAGFKGYDVIYGKMGGHKTHVWLENENFLIDITADQFKTASSYIILCKLDKVRKYIGYKSTGPGSLDLGGTVISWGVFIKELARQGASI